MCTHSPPAYIGLCIDCGARHEVKRQDTLCMCGGKIIDIDKLAALAHRLWWHWSQTIADEENISDERTARWQQLWIEYSKLDDDMQQTDRELVENNLKEQ